PLIAGRPDPKPRGQVRILGATRQAYGAAVGDLGEKGAEGQHEGDATAPSQFCHSAAVGAPPEVWLDGYPHDQVAIDRGRLTDRKLGGRPDDLALGVRAGFVADVRTRQAEVIELLRIDARQALGRPELGQVAGSCGGGLGRIVPARERHDEDRLPEAGGLFVNAEMLAHVFLTRLSEAFFRGFRNATAGVATMRSS